MAQIGARPDFRWQFVDRIVAHVHVGQRLQDAPRELRQYLYFSTSKAGKVRDIVAHVHVGQRLQIAPQDLRQYLYICTSKAGKVSTCRLPISAGSFLRQYLYFCTSNAGSKVSTPADCRSQPAAS